MELMFPAEGGAEIVVEWSRSESADTGPDRGALAVCCFAFGGALRAHNVEGIFGGVVGDGS